jgi:RNA polymerase sigma-70 factor (ECF subfamily)
VNGLPARPPADGRPPPTFDRVLAEHGPALRRLVAAWERDAAAREDLLQEILLALWRALPSFRGECSPRTFVLRVAHNRALTHRFRPRRDGEPLEAALHVAHPDPGPEAEAAAAQRLERLRRALRALPVPARQVLTLSLEGLSGAEIAAVLGTTEGNAWVRLSRARRALKEELDRS